MKYAKSYFEHLALLLSVICSFLLSTHVCADKTFSPEDRSHWAFQPLRRPTVPQVETSTWSQNSIDAFILAKLRSQGIDPGGPADKITLLRRASFDLTGLPPTPAEADAFLADDSGETFANAVDRLLASPRYGERWARHWLDLARYAESEGFKADETRPNVWRYRDYVIKSFNNDKPYDRFVQEQIAGDELWPDNPDALIATGFNRHYPDESNARNLMQRRQEILNDITDTVGAVFTGLTYGCARCHDHKYDPILQKDYFRLQAFFANTAAADNIPLAQPAAVEEYNEKLALWQEKTKDIQEQLDALETAKRAEIIKDYFDKYPEQVQAALNKPFSLRTPFECQMAAKAELYLNPASHQYIASSATVGSQLKGDTRKKWDELSAELKKFAALHPGPLPIASGITDISHQAPKTFLLGKGAWDSPKDEIEPGFLTILNSANSTIPPPAKSNSTGRRAALAKLLTSPENPLAARVMVNRIWRYHFGRGIVETPSDFGLKGAPPTHPALLDWLASEFIQSGWSIKHIHRIIMASSVYQQTSLHRETAAKVDPDNQLYWKFPRRRLEGEVIRDSALHVAGLLNPKMGGPSVFPELPGGMENRYGWKVTAEAEERNRRSIYVFVRRNIRYPMFETFDMPDTHESCARRSVTTSPIQALNMMNGKLSLSWAQHFAGRILESASASRDQQIETAFRMAFTRSPLPSEKKAVLKFWERQHDILEERLDEGSEVAFPSKLPSNIKEEDAAALVDLCHTLLNSNEFVYLN